MRRLPALLFPLLLCAPVAAWGGEIAAQLLAGGSVIPASKLAAGPLIGVQAHAGGLFDPRLQLEGGFALSRHSAQVTPSHTTTISVASLGGRFALDLAPAFLYGSGGGLFFSSRRSDRPDSFSSPGGYFGVGLEGDLGLGLRLGGEVRYHLLLSSPSASSYTAFFLTFGANRSF